MTTKEAGLGKSRALISKAAKAAAPWSVRGELDSRCRGVVMRRQAEAMMNGGRMTQMGAIGAIIMEYGEKYGHSVLPGSNGSGKK